MAYKKKNPVTQIKQTDGRKNNGRKPSKIKTKEIAKKKANITPAQLNPAKKKQISSYAIKAMKKVFGSEAEAWENLAEQAKDSFAHMNLLMQYAYGKAGEQKEDNGSSRSKAPVINFYATPQQIEQAQDTTIDIDADIVDADELNEEDDEQ